MVVSVFLFSGFTRVATVPAGSTSKAALVGANTVKGPAEAKVETRSAAFTAATKVVWSLLFTAFSTIFFDGYMAAPPTITVFSDCAKTAAVQKMKAAVNSIFILLFMMYCFV